MGRISKDQMTPMLAAATQTPDVKRVAVDDAAQLLGSGSSRAGQVLAAFGIKLAKGMTEAEVGAGADAHELLAGVAPAAGDMRAAWGTVHAGCAARSPGGVVDTDGCAC